MTKSSREQITKDGKKVLAELMKNAKENLDEIAKQCNFSSQKVRRAIKQLEENNTIWGYSAIFNEEKIGLKHYTLLIKKSNKKIEERIVDQIISRKIEDLAVELRVTLESSYYVHGEYDWIITLTAEDINAAKRFTDTLNHLNEGIIERIAVLQTMMFIRKQYTLNPERTKLKEFM